VLMSHFFNLRGQISNKWSWLIGKKLALQLRLPIPRTMLLGSPLAPRSSRRVAYFV
jgi:hypothetical protein